MDTSATPQQRALVEAGIALTSELSLDAVLQRLTGLAAELTGARYAALGVLDAEGASLEKFLTHGVTDDVYERIGRLPRGRGILGVVVQETRPLRLHDLHDDPRAVGFPDGHPEMRTFLGVPIMLRGTAYGNLYLTEKEGGEDFSEVDEEIVVLLAAQAAVAVENARLFEAATRWSRQLETLHEIALGLAGELELSRLLDLIAQRLKELLGARVVAVLLPREAGRLEVAASAGADLVGTSLTSETKSARVFARGVSERVDALYQDAEADGTLTEQLDANAGLFVPLVARDRIVGLLVAIDREGQDPRFSDDDLRLVENFASRAAVAVELSERVARDVHLRVVEAQEQERRRLARELHDETGQALTSILLGLRAAEDAPDVESMREAVAQLRELVVSTLQSVRRLAVELRPKALDDFGLEPALLHLADGFRDGTGLRLEIESRLGDARLAPDVETAIYRIVQEALTNVIKHAGAGSVSILLTRKNGRVSVVIEDDGRGFDPGSAESAGGVGLLGISERVRLLGGSLTIESSAGHGSALHVDLPAA